MHNAHGCLFVFSTALAGIILAPASSTSIVQPGNWRSVVLSRRLFPDITLCVYQIVYLSVTFWGLLRIRAFGSDVPFGA